MLSAILYIRQKQKLAAIALLDLDQGAGAGGWEVLRFLDCKIVGEHGSII